ncbi:1,4-dihydroxy-2-naphthoate polyprenyltransferase [Granulicatella sp.]
MKDIIELVELRTKIASVIPFVVGLLYSIWTFGNFNVVNMVLFFIGMVCFDMATTVMNNLMDYVKAKNETYRQEENIIGTSSLTVKQATMIFGGLVGVATLIGIILVVRTNIILLFVGMLCFVIGIFYTFGPIPISRMPLGEVLSGVTMGFGIFWIVIFLNAPEASFAWMGLEQGMLVVRLALIDHFKVALLSLPLVCTIANIMLSNNLCDLETDITNHRYTLVYYIGNPAALKLYQGLYLISFVAMVLAIVFRIAPILMLGTLVVGIPVYKNSQLFLQKQEKRTTFVLAIKNMLMIHVVQMVLLLISVIFFR